MAEAADWLATLKPTMVNELHDVPGNTRTVFVGAATIDGVEGIVHIIGKRGKYFAKFTSDDEYRQRWGR